MQTTQEWIFFLLNGVQIKWGRAARVKIYLFYIRGQGLYRWGVGKCAQNEMMIHAVGRIVIRKVVHK